MSKGLMWFFCIAVFLVGCQQNPQQRKESLLRKISEMEKKYTSFNAELSHTKKAQHELLEKISTSEKEVEKAGARNVVLTARQKKTKRLLKILERQRMTAQKLFTVIESQAKYEKCQAETTLILSRMEKKRAEFFVEVANHMACQAKKSKRKSTGALLGLAAAFFTGGASLAFSAAGYAAGSLGRRCDHKPSPLQMKTTLNSFVEQLEKIKPRCELLQDSYKILKREYQKRKFEEEREYIDSCSQGESEECHRIGKMYAAGLDVAQSYTRAVQFYKKACRRGHGEACADLGWLHQRGKGVFKSYKNARRLYRKACDLNFGTGCSNLGYLFYRGRGGRRSKSKALGLYEKACKLKSGVGCNQLGNMFLKGRGVRKNAGKASVHFKRSCALSYRFGCYNLGYLYKYGRGVAKNCTLASQFFQKACVMGSSSACRNRCR